MLLAIARRDHKIAAMVAGPTTSGVPVRPTVIPPLKHGDRLARAEFERRYDAMPNLKRAELIEGVVHVPPATRWDNHAVPRADLIACFGYYRGGTPGVRVGDAGSIRLDLTNEPQPDITMLIDPALGGLAVISSDDYIEGSPELVAEISASSISTDLNSKLAVYQRNGVREYVVWRVYEGEIDWYSLAYGQYQKLAKHSDGAVHSMVFPGLWIDVAAIIRGDIATAIRMIQQGLDSAEHQAFVALLQTRRKSPSD